MTQERDSRLSHELPQEITRSKEIDLISKVAIVTGASRGIGRAIALKLAFHGADIIGVSRDHVDSHDGNREAKEVQLSIKSFGRKVNWIYGDVRDSQTAQRAFETAMKEHGHVDILVNNAGTTKDSLIPRMKEEDWDLVMDTKVKGAYFFVKASYLQMARQQAGTIINISSDAGQVGSPGQGNYSAANGALESFTRTVARELAPRGVRANVVSPGFVETALTSKYSNKQKEEISSATPMKGDISAEDVAEMVLFLASDRSRYITGQTLRIDGGLVMG